MVGNETPALEPKNLQKPTTYDPPRGAMTCYDRQYLSKQDIRRLLRLLNIRKTSHFVEEKVEIVLGDAKPVRNRNGTGTEPRSGTQSADSAGSGRNHSSDHAQPRISWYFYLHVADMAGNLPTSGHLTLAWFRSGNSRFRHGRSTRH